MKIVLVGAGSVSFSQGLLADIMLSDFCSGWTVGLVDTNPDALEVVRQLAERMLEAHPAPVRLEASTERKDMLPGAEAVVTTIGVGGRRAWERDVYIPREFGIYQPVGDSVMAGGLSRALRQIPPMVDIARDVLALAPQAWLFNYANPMTTICRAVRYTTGARIVGLCHGVINTLRRIARQLGVSVGELNGQYVGVNHLTFLLNLRLHGRDIWPQFKELAHREFSADNPFCCELLDLYDAWPMVSDRHTVEFFPGLFRNGNYYGKKLGIEVFSMEEIIEHGDARFEQMARMARGAEPLDESLFDRAPGEHEQLVDILKSCLGDEQRIFSANVPNAGAVSNAPRDMVLELPCVFDAGGAHPVVIGEVPAWLAAILAQRHWVTELTVQAALTGCAKTFAQALLAEGQADSIAGAQKLADALIKAQAEHLPQFA